MRIKDSGWHRLTIELVFIVGGILIALAIDNWNQQREAREDELRLLGEVREDLLRDRDTLGEVYKHRDQAIDAIDAILEAMESDGPPPDDLESHLAQVFTLNRVAFRNGAYEVIKASAQRLSDANLRIALSDYYEYRAPIFIENVRDIEDSFKRFWLPFVIENIDEWQYRSYARPVDMERLLDDARFRRLLRAERGNSMSIVQRAPVLDQYVEYLIALIDCNVDPDAARQLAERADEVADGGETVPCHVLANASIDLAAD